MKTTEISVDLKTGETTTKKDGVTYHGTEGFIASQRDMLIGFRDDGREPSQDLLDDIACYEFILEHKKVKEYMDWRDASWEKRPREFLKEQREKADG